MEYRDFDPVLALLGGCLAFLGLMLTSLGFMAAADVAKSFSMEMVLLSAVNLSLGIGAMIFGYDVLVEGLDIYDPEAHWLLPVAVVLLVGAVLIVILS